MNAPGQILIIDDNDTMREGLELLMRRRGHGTRSAEGGEQGLRLLEDEGADLVITDLKMVRVDGMKVLEQVKSSSPDTEVLVITGYGTVEKAVQAMKLGACDFITKPFSSEEFAIKVDRILRERRARLELQQENLALRVKNTYLRSQTGDEPPVPYGEMVGESDGIRQVKRLVARVARSDSTAMIYGESGTGKELVARAIHARSGRHGGPFIRVNCGAMPEGLLDSELFGHEAGAFTDARKRRRGRFELADGGTLFLDEISTISHATQVRLLRVLQERELERVGGEETIPVDVRIVAATNTPAEELLAGNGFREDLYYRLHVFPVFVPPLRERKDDIPLLANHFIEKLQGRTRSQVTSIGDEAMKQLVEYDWPGNVRELENVIERALVLAEGEALLEDDLPFLANLGTGDDGRSLAGPMGDQLDLVRAVEEFEARLIRQALERAGGVKAEAARLLKLKKATLGYKIEKHGI